MDGHPGGRGLVLDAWGDHPGCSRGASCGCCCIRNLLRALLPSDAAENRIDAILDQIRQYTTHIDWMVFPGCQPADLGARLDGTGYFTILENQLIGELGGAQTTAERC